MRTIGEVRSAVCDDTADEVLIEDIDAAARYRPIATTTHLPPNPSATVVDMAAVDAAFVLEASPPAPVLITEGEVVFATAAAAVSRPAVTHRWNRAPAVFVATMHRLFTRPDARPSRRSYPRRYEYLERACMARAMDRL